MIREVTEADLPFLRQMLHAAAFWRPDRGGVASRLVGFAKRALMRLLMRGYLRQYYEGWGRVGDVGFVAEIEGRPVGAVWYRSFTETRHGDGFIDEGTPELVVAVVPSARGRGIGRSLMLMIHDEAPRRGLSLIGLSVDRDNPAKRLYAQLGYVDYEPADRKGRMILDLRQHGREP